MYDFIYKKGCVYGDGEKKTPKKREKKANKTKEKFPFWLPHHLLFYKKTENKPDLP